MLRARFLYTILLFSLTAGVPSLSPSEAEAQLQSSGSMRSSPRSSPLGASTRSTSSVGSRVREDDRNITTTRTTSSTEPFSKDDDSSPNNDAKPSAEDDDPSEKTIEPDYDDRTLGRACMYGVDDEVIYRPKGARCRGDAPAAPAKTASEPPSQRTNGRVGAPDDRRKPAPVDRATRSRPATASPLGVDGSRTTPEPGTRRTAEPQ